MDVLFPTGVMFISFDEIPFDVLFLIAAYLDYDDIISLGHSCQQLKMLLHVSALCQRTLKVWKIKILAVIELSKTRTTSDIPKRRGWLSSNSTRSLGQVYEPNGLNQSADPRRPNPKQKIYIELKKSKRFIEMQ